MTRWARPALVLAVLSTSFAAIFLRLAQPTHPLVLSAARLGMAAVVLAIPTFRAWRAGRLPVRHCAWALACGALYAVHFGAWVTSLEQTSVASSVTLVTATPLLLAMAALITGRDRPERRHWLAIGLALAGLLLVGWRDQTLSPGALRGDGLALVGAAAMAGYLWIARSLGKDLDVLGLAGIATASGALLLLAAALLLRVPLVFASPVSIGWVALAALLPQLVGHTLLTWSLRHATPTAVGIATVGEPVGATILAWIALGERVDVVVGVGCALTLAAVGLSFRRGS